MTAVRDFQVIPVPGAGAEDVVVAAGEHSGDHDGGGSAAEPVVYTGTDDGSVFRLSPDGSRIERVAHTGGRPLGLELLPDGGLLVCDADAGLLRVEPATGAVAVLASEHADRAFRFCNNAAVAADGRVWFSDSSLHHGQPEWKADFVQDTRSGRLLRRDHDGTLTVLLDRLAFANGVALAADESFVAVAETAARRVTRLWLGGGRSGERDLLVDDLPGYPDNLSRGSDGLLWVAIASPRDPMVERLQRAPMAVRRLVTRIPEALQPKPQRTIRAQAYDDEGRLMHDVDLDDDRFHMVTGVREHQGRLWLGSLEESAVAVADL